MGTDTANYEVAFSHFLSAAIHCVFTEFRLESPREGEELCRAIFAPNFGHISIIFNNTCKYLFSTLFHSTIGRIK